MSKDFDCYSIDDGAYSEGNKNDALKSLQSIGELKIGETYYLGKQKELKASDFFHVDDFLEYIGDRAYDEHGECAEDFPDVAKEKRNELGALIENWLDKNINVEFWGVDEVTEFTVTEQDIKDMEQAND